jgi:hypothetical protein
MVLGLTLLSQPVDTIKVSIQGGFPSAAVDIFKEAAPRVFDEGVKARVIAENNNKVQGVSKSGQDPRGRSFSKPLAVLK